MTAPPGAPAAPRDAQRVERFLAAVAASGMVEDERGEPREVGLTGLRDEQGRALARLVEREAPERTLETGFAFGLSGLWIVLGALRGGARAPRHLAVDPFQTAAYGGAGRASFAAVGLGEALSVDERGSELALPELLRAGERFDLAFIDGSHLFEHVLLDLFYLARLVRPGGLVMVDDTWMPAVRAAVDYFVRNVGLRLEAPYRRRAPLLERLRGRPFEHAPMAVLRVPEERPARAWDSFVPLDWR